jgi:hypothetical protein
MRQPLHLLRYVVLLWVLSVSALAHADDRADARTHYQTAAKMYQGGDYRGAIREFSAAQQLVPADLNNYNLALCYDKLGDAEPAIQYYRAFLDKQPGTDKRAEIQASIDRLDAALKSASAKKADDAKKADEAKKADDDKHPVLGPVAPDAAAIAGAGAAGAAAGGSVAGGVAVGPAPAPTVGPEGPPAPSEAAPAPAPAPRKKHKGPAVAAPNAATTGDAQLDRVNGLNIDEIRDQRLGPQGEAAGPNGPNGNGPAVAGAQPGQPSQPNAQPSVTGVAPMNNGDEPKKETPVYKKWWFWAVVAVGGYVVYQLATSSSSTNGDTTIHPATGVHHAPSAGLTLLHF